MGLPVAIWAGGLLESGLFGIRNGDPLILAAALVPARRATAIDPIRALRAE